MSVGEVFDYDLSRYEDKIPKIYPDGERYKKIRTKNYPDKNTKETDTIFVKRSDHILFHFFLFDIKTMEIFKLKSERWTFYYF